MLKCSSLRTSESNSRISMRSDWASVPMRGSRFTGLNSMSITSVLESGDLAQERRKTKSANHKGHKGTQREPERVWIFHTPACLLANLRVPSCPLWLTIRNLAENNRPFGAGGGRDVSGAAMPRL